MLSLRDLIAPTEIETPVDTIESTPTDGQVNVEAPVVETPTEYDVDGEKYTIDQIREWKQGNLRQSDYTRKTQEIAKLRKESEQAMEVYKYLMENQELTKMLVEHQQANGKNVDVTQNLDPVRQELNDIKQKITLDEIDKQLSNITSKDKRVSDVELLEIANARACDIDTAYNIWKGQNMDKIMTIREQELKKSILNELQTNANQTATMIGGVDTKVEQNTFGLSQEQIGIAEKFGMTLEEYKKYTTNDGVW